MIYHLSYVTWSSWSAYFDPTLPFSNSPASVSPIYSIPDWVFGGLCQGDREAKRKKNKKGNEFGDSNAEKFWHDHGPTRRPKLVPLVFLISFTTRTRPRPPPMVPGTMPSKRGYCKTETAQPTAASKRNHVSIPVKKSHFNIDADPNLPHFGLVIALLASMPVGWGLNPWRTAAILTSGLDPPIILSPSSAPSLLWPWLPSKRSNRSQEENDKKTRWAPKTISAHNYSPRLGRILGSTLSPTIKSEPLKKKKKKRDFN